MNSVRGVEKSGNKKIFTTVEFKAKREQKQVGDETTSGIRSRRSPNNERLYEIKPMIPTRKAKDFFESGSNKACAKTEVDARSNHPMASHEQTNTHQPHQTQNLHGPRHGTGNAPSDRLVQRSSKYRFGTCDFLGNDLARRRHRRTDGVSVLVVPLSVEGHRRRSVLVVHARRCAKARRKEEEDEEEPPRREESTPRRVRHFEEAEDSVLSSSLSSRLRLLCFPLPSSICDDEVLAGCRLMMVSRLKSLREEHREASPRHDCHHERSRVLSNNDNCSLTFCR